MPLPPPSDPNTPIIPLPTTTPPVPKTPGGGVKKVLLNPMVLFGAIGFLVVVIIGLSIWGTSNAQKANIAAADLQAKYDAGLAEGKESQRAADQNDFFAQQNAEFRTYKAPDAFGGFEIGFPRQWSFQLTAENGDQISGISNPDLIDYTGDKRFGLRYGLKAQKFSELRKGYDAKAAAKKAVVTATQISVSGIDSMQYVGNIDNNKANVNSSIVLIPVRDKTFYLQTDRYDGYKEVFAKIIASTKVFP